MSIAQGYDTYRPILGKPSELLQIEGHTMRQTGTFKGWLKGRGFGFIVPDDNSTDIFLHMSKIANWWEVRGGARLEFEAHLNDRGREARDIVVLTFGPNYGAQHPKPLPSAIVEDKPFEDEQLISEDIEDLGTKNVALSLLAEISKWKREAKAEDNERYFWHVREVDQISQGEKYFVIGRKGAGKTAICEHFNRINSYDVFAERLSFKNFPFNELYTHKNNKYTEPNQFITIWKCLIYNTVCRLMLKNQALDEDLRTQLSKLYEDKTTLSRRIGKWVGKEFGISLLGLSLKLSKSGTEKEPTDWIENVNVVEDLLSQYAGDATYYVLFDELDEDYRDMLANEQYEQYTALITSLFKAVQDVRMTFGQHNGLRLYPVIFLRDDIYDLVQDSDKNKWGDFKVDLNWDQEKIKRLVAFRISRALDPACSASLRFEDAWELALGTRRIGIGGRGNKVSTFEFITRSTLLRPRDFVSYLQNCAQHAVDNNTSITPEVVRYVDKAFSNYLRQELTDELFAILPDIANIFDAISQLRKWNFSILELELAYGRLVEQGFIQEKNVKLVLQILFSFSVIGNAPRPGRYVFRYQNREARLNFNERIVVHRGLFKALQIL